MFKRLISSYEFRVKRDFPLISKINSKFLSASPLASSPLCQKLESSCLLVPCKRDGGKGCVSADVQNDFAITCIISQKQAKNWEKQRRRRRWRRRFNRQLRALEKPFKLRWTPSTTLVTRFNCSRTNVASREKPSNEKTWSIKSIALNMCRLDVFSFCIN